MPDTLELPRMRTAVIPLVRPGYAVVEEIVTDSLPIDAAIAGTLDDLAVPTGILGGVDAVGVRGRTFQMVDLPAREMRT